MGFLLRLEVKNILTRKHPWRENSMEKLCLQVQKISLSFTTWGKFAHVRRVYKSMLRKIESDIREKWGNKLWLLYQIFTTRWCKDPKSYGFEIQGDRIWHEREREIEIFLNSGFIFIHNRTSIHRRGESQERALHMRDIYGEIWRVSQHSKSKFSYGCEQESQDLI
jgi:hypothetical protein